MVLGIMAAVSCGKSGTGEYSVMKGPFRQSFTETGELEAVKAAALVVPRINYEFGYQYKILSLAEHGKMVKAGDTVIRLDPSTIQKFIITKEEALQNELAAEKKQQVQIENNLQDLRAQLHSEEAGYELKKLEMERARFDTDNKRKVKELEFKQSTIRINKIKRLLDRRPIMDGYDSRVQKIKVSQGEADVEAAKGILNRLVLVSPEDGLFQVSESYSDYPPKNLRVGDQVEMGQMIARIPDIFHMKVRTFVNETDFTKIRVGMDVLVRLDALPDVPFHGVITDISKICLQQEKDKVFKVVVMVSESDLRLKPGMTVSCEYICREEKDALYVPNNCLLKEEGKSFVFLKKGGAPVKTEVKAGPSNSFHTLIYSDIVAGQALVPFETVMKKNKS